MQLVYSNLSFRNLDLSRFLKRNSSFNHFHPSLIDPLNSVLKSILFLFIKYFFNLQ